MLALVAEEYTMILGAETDQRRLDVPKLLCIALPSLGLAGQRLEDLQGNGLFNAADIGLGLFGPGEALSHYGGASLPVAAPGPSFPNRPWSSRTPPGLPHGGSAGCA